MKFAAPEPQPWTRRRWIKHFMLGTVMALGPGQTWRGTLLADIAPGTPPTDIISLDLTNFPDLMNGNTPSIQLVLNAYNMQVIMINLVPFNAQFYVLDSRCTHQGCIVPPWNAQQNILCPCHGSNYLYDGSLIYGAAGPMQPPLATYNFNYDGANLLQIQVPGLDLTINSITVQASSPTNQRLHLSFPAEIGGAYQVGASTDLANWTDPINFALTATGAANNSSMIAPATGTQDIWVDNPNPGANAFFRVELILANYNGC